MKTRLNILITLCCLLLPLSARTAEDQKADVGLTNRVQALLDAYAGADDLMDERLLQKRAELEAMGEKAYPALCEILRTNNNPMCLSSVIDVFLRSEGDKKEPLKAVRDLLKTRREHKYGPAHRAALKLLAENGATEDISLVAEYANSDDLVTKTIAGKSKAMIEKRIAAHPPSNTAHGSGVTNDASGNAEDNRGQP
jgi:hypothetical protein